MPSWSHTGHVLISFSKMLIPGGTGLLVDVVTGGFEAAGGGGGLGWGGDEGLATGGGGGLAKGEEEIFGTAEGSWAGRGGFGT